MILHRSRNNDQTGRSRRSWKMLSGVLVLCAITGCSGVQTKSNAMWLENGSIGLSRPVPQPSSMKPEQPLLGFMPTKHSQAPQRLVIDRSAQSISLVSSNAEISMTTTAQCDQLAPGSYSVALKQRAPVWYAPDSYFSARELAVPPSGSTERFRRGALGEYAIFLSDQTPLHSGPVASSEIGGVQLDEKLLAKLFELLELGMPVEVR